MSEKFEQWVEDCLASPKIREMLWRRLVGPMVIGLACGLATAALRHGSHLPALVLWNNVSAEIRASFWLSTWLGAFCGPWVFRGAELLGDRWNFGTLVSKFLWNGLLPIAFLPFLGNVELWLQAPLFMQFVAAAFAALVSLLLFPLPMQRFFPSEPGQGPKNVPPSTPPVGELDEHPKAWLAAVVIAATIYTGYISYHHVLHHYALGSLAYDLGIMENVFWNSIHGDLFGSSIERGQNHLGVHTSFIFLPLLPIYALAPFTETLLILQSLFVGAAAIPLYLLAVQSGLRCWVGFSLALIYLVHPAIGSANFYDFHELAFLPIFFFGIFLFRQSRRPVLFWLCVLGLLSVKEDMSILLALIGVYLVLDRDALKGFKLSFLGVAAFVFCQKIVIPIFAGGDHSFAWYYTEMIPGGEGPLGLIKTMVTNPLYSIRYPFDPQKLLYILQLFAPLAFLPLFPRKGMILLLYGFVVSLFSNRPALYEMGFQYAFLMLAPALVVTVMALRSLSDLWQKRFLTMMLCFTTWNVFHHGWIYPRHNVKGGFGRVDFKFDEVEKERLDLLHEMIALIPEQASVTANEELVPHLARRKYIETLRYAMSGGGRAYEYYLLRNNSETQAWIKKYYPEVVSFRAYQLVKQNREFTLLRRKAEFRNRE